MIRDVERILDGLAERGGAEENFGESDHVGVPLNRGAGRRNRGGLHVRQCLRAGKERRERYGRDEVGVELGRIARGNPNEVAGVGGKRRTHRDGDDLFGCDDRGAPASSLAFVSTGLPVPSALVNTSTLPNQATSVIHLNSTSVLAVT